MARANGIDIKLPDLQQQIVFNVSGEDKLKSIGRALNDIASGTKMHQYLSDQETMVRRLIEAYTQYGRIQNRSSAGELIKSFNALQAVSDGIDLSRVIEGFDQVDAAFKRASADFGKDFTGFSTEHFRDVANAMAELGRYGADVDKVFSRLGQDADVERLNQQIEQLEFSVGRLQSRLRDVTEERDNLLNGSELQRLQEVEEKFSNLTDTMADEFRAFLRANDLESDEDPWSRYYSYFEQIRDGSMTAKEAITRVRSEMADMIRTADAGDTIFSYTQMDEFIQKLTVACEQIEQMRGEIAALSDTAALRGVAQEMSESADLTDKQREAMHGLIQESDGLQSVSQILAVMVDNFDMTDDKIAQSVTSFKELLSVLDSIAHVEPANMSGFNDVLKNLRMVSELDVDKKKMTALNEALQQMAAIPQLSNIANLGSVDLRGFNDIKVSKAALSNLATYLPELSQNVNVERLQALSQVSLANFSADNLKVSKASFDHLRELIDTIRGTSDTDAFSQYDYSAGTSMADAVEQVTQKVKQEKEAFREGVEAKKEDAAAAEAAAKAEDDKRKISELLAAALKREEEATDSTSRSAERHTDVIQQQEDAMWEAYRTEQGMHDKSASETEAEIDREIAAYNKRLDAQQAADDKAQKVWEQEEASAMAAADKKADSEERAAERKVKAAEKAAAAAAAAEQKAAEAAVKRTAYDDAKRAVNQYYGLLTSKDTNAAKRADVVMTDAGWASQSGKYAELAQQLNDATASFNMLTDAQNKNNLSGQQIAAINELIATRQKDYALAVENTAAKEAEHAQRSAELAQKKQAEAEAANAAKEAKKQEAEATKAQAQAERDAAKAAKTTAQNANTKTNQIKALNALLVKCEAAERKYAAAAKLSNARENYAGIQTTKEKVQELLRELKKEKPDLDMVAVGLRNCTEEYSRNSTALQTNTSLVGRYVTTGVQQLKSRLTESLGLAAVVTKSVHEVRKMITTAVDLDSAMNTLQIVTRASGEEMDEYGKRVSSMAKETAQATKDLIDATTVYARLGYSMDESAILSKYTAMLQSVGDIDASSAQNAITAIIKAFDKGVNDIEDVMDKMVLVGNGFPISVAQIAEGMNNAGSMLNVAGNSFEESIALLTAANSTIQNISKASTGLRTIAARIRKTTTGEDDEGEIVEEAKYQEMINALTRHHVDLIDKETNQYRSTYEIIKDIAAVWGELTSMEQAAVVEALAGTRQQNIFASLMTQFGTAEDAVDRMKNSAGELQEAYDIRMQSIQAHINTLKAAFDELSMKVVNSDLAKGFIDIVTKIVEGLTALIDKIGGVGVALSVLGGIAAVKFLTGGGIAGLVLDISKLVMSLGSIAALLPELALFAGATLALVGLVAGIKKLKQAYDEAHPSFDQAKKMLAETDKAVDDLNAKIDENNTRIRELEAAYKEGDFTVVQEAELTKLEAENALLEAQLELEKQIQEERQKKVHETAVETANTLLGNNAEKNPYAQTIQNVIDNYRQAQEDLEKAQNYYTERGDKATKTDKTYVDVAMYNLEQRGAELNNVLNQIAEVTAALDPEKDKDLIDALTKSVADFTKTIDGNSKKSKKWAADLKDLEKRYGSNLDALKRLARGEQVTREEGEKLRRWMLDCRYTAEDLAEMLSQMGVELTQEQGETAGAGGTYLDAQISKWGTMSDEIERAKKAIEDYNNAMSGGNNGDTAAQMEEAWKKAVEDIDSGRIDSRAVWAFAEMAMSPQQIADLKFDATRIAQEIKGSFYQEMFKDEENDDGYSYGQRLLLQLEQNLDHLQGVNVWSDDTGLHYWIEDFAALANQLNVSEGFLDALLDDLDAYGSQLLTDTRQNTELVNTFLDIKDKATDAREAMKEFIAVSFANDKDMSDTTMARILQGLHEQGYLEIDPTEYLKVIGEVRAENAKLEEDNPVVTPELNDQPLVDGVNTMMNNIQSWLNSHPLVVSVRGNDDDLPNSTNSSGNNSDSSGSSKESKKKSTESLSGKKASAGGKRAGTGGGNTLVNEDGPELISDDGRAFIANGGKPGFVYLTKDAIVFNADDTEEILRRGRFNGTVRALAKGTGHTARSSLIGRLLSGRQYPAKRQVKGTQVGGSSTSYTKPSQHSTSTHVSTTTTAASSWVCPHCGRICGANASYCYGCGWPDHMQQELPQTNSNFYAQANGKIRVEYNGGEQYWYTPNNNTDYEAQYELQQQIAEAKRAEKAAKEALERARVKSIQDANLQKRVNAASAGGAGSGSGYAGSGGGNYVGGADYASASDPQKVDWVAVRINRLQRTIADLEKVASSGFKKLDLRLSKTKDQIAKTTEEIGVMNSAYNRYMQEANSVGLDSSIAGKVQNGTIDITEYDEETRKKIDEYTEWYEKAIDAQSAVEELHQNIAQLYVDSFEMVQTDFENQLAQIEHDANMTSKNLEMAQTRGYLDNASFYQQLADNQISQIAKMKTELDGLNQKMKEAMASGEIAEGSEAWYQMKQSINEVKEAIADANIQLVEYQRTIRKLSWDYFDYAQERFSQMTAEAQFFVDLMSNHDLFQENGQFNQLGEATASMHAVNYDAYMAQADAYAQEILKIQKDLESDPYDTELISRREQLLQLQRQSILSAEGEKNAVKDLVQNGINIELEALKDLIDAYNDSLDSAKDLYEYQKSITEKTADIASMQKQLSAYQNDTSEETRARVQKLTQNLEKAQTDLREAEWDRSISDQKKLLDEVYDEYEEYLNQRLDNIDLLMQEMINSTNMNMDSIRNTLTEVGNEVGYSMTDQLAQAMSADLTYYDHMSTEISSVQTVLNNIYSMVAAMARASGAVKAYATGGLVDYTGLAAVHGSKGKPELMLNASDTANFLEAAKMMREMAGTTLSLSTAPGFGSGGGMTIGQLQVNIPIDRVLDYNDLITQLRDDPKFERLVNAMTLDRAVGKSAFGKNRIVF